MEHVLVWEKAHGPIPPGYQVHHKDENKLNNDLDNLELLDPLTHKRLHSGCYIENGRWKKPCIKCKNIKDVDDDYYFKSTDNAVDSYCKTCRIAASTKNKQERRLRALQQAV